MVTSATAIAALLPAPKTTGPAFRRDADPNVRFELPDFGGAAAAPAADSTAQPRQAGADDTQPDSRAGGDTKQAQRDVSGHRPARTGKQTTAGDGRDAAARRADGRGQAEADATAGTAGAARNAAAASGNDAAAAAGAKTDKDAKADKDAKHKSASDDTDAAATAAGAATQAAPAQAAADTATAAWLPGALPGQGDAASGAGDASKTAAAVAAAGHDAGNATAGAAVRAATAAAQLQALVASTPADARGTAAAAAGTADDADGQADTQAGSVAAAPAGTAAPTLAQTVANLLKMFDGGGTSPSKSADASATDPAAAASTAAAANAPAAAGTQAAAGGNLHALFTSLLHAAGTASAALHGAAGDAGAASVGAGGDPTAQQAPAAGPAAPQNLAAFLNLSGSAATRGADAGAATLQSLAQPIAMHDAGWQDALSGRVHMLLQTADDGSSNEARIQLHPRDLGSIQVHVRMGSDGADVRFAATHPDVRHQLESSLPRLRELLASGGLALAQAHVGSQFSQHSQQSQQGAATASRRGAAAVNDAGGVEMDGIRPVRIASVSLIDDYA